MKNTNQGKLKETITFGQTSIYHYDKLNRSYHKMREYLKEGVKLPFVIWADTLTAPEGRSGKKYHAPHGGIWMTYAGKYNEFVHSKYAIICAYAMMKALESQGVRGINIKWPNDLYLNGKKICGILIHVNKDIIDIGIGVNTNVHNFPEDLRDKATSLLIETKKKKYDNLEIIKSYLNNFYRLEKNIELPLDKIDPVLLHQDKQVKIVSGNRKTKGILKGVTKDGFALVDEQIINDGSLFLDE